MAELPKQLPSLRKRLDFSIQEIIRWQELAKRHQFTDDIQQQIDLFLTCHYAAQSCIDGDAIQASRITEQAHQIANLWRVTPSGRGVERNLVQDRYAGIHDDTLNTFSATAAEVIEDLLDWEFTVASARAAQFGFQGQQESEAVEFHAEDALLLCQVQALRACCESIIPIYWEQKEVTRHKILVAQYEIAAWNALVQVGTQQY